MARLALDNRVPVVAVAMIGTREVQPIGRVWPRLFRPVTVRFSPPMQFDHHTGWADDPTVLRAVTDEIMFELRELSGQEYVDRYAKRKDVVEGAEPARIAALPAA